MNKFVRNLITEWRKLALPVAGETAIIAVSGGADSAALLAAFADMRKRGKIDHDLIAAHFNHGLRGGASLDDQSFVERLAGDLGVEFVVGSGSIRKRGNLEQNAREARYAFLHQLAAERQANLVLVGHTMNDQAETFLMNLIRGSGPDGLSAMDEVRNLKPQNDNIRLVRPLLRWAKREHTEAFCRDAAIDFRRDAMNDDPAFSRVRVRKIVIPLLEEFNPKVIDTLCSTAGRIGDLVPDATADEFTETLAVSELASLPEPEMIRTVRSWLGSRRGTLRGIQAKHLEAVGRLILSRKSGRAVELPGRQTVSKQGGRLVFKAIMVEK